VAVDWYGSLRLELDLYAGEPVAKEVQARREEQVEVAALGYVAARCDGFREALAFEYRHRLRMLGQRSCSKQARHASPDDDDPTLTQLCHSTPPAPPQDTPQVRSP
jgi:hypothetical protein